jgi:uncharacterized protein YndB with AHSA1/START domain
MDLDPVTAAGFVTREVRTGERDGVTTRIVVARRIYETDQGDLWHAITDPERIPRWFLPVSGELRLGGRYQLEGNAGGVIEACDEPDHLAVTWEFAEQVSWLDVALTPTDGGTALELAHEAPVDPDLWAQFGPGAAGVGWDLGLLGLGLHLDTGEPVDPSEAESWSVSPLGVEFVRQAAHGWAEAAVADGDARTAAREAAERTAGFYTTMPDG